MALSDTQLVQVRVQIGDSTPPTDSDLDDIYDRVLSVPLVVTEVLQRRLANLLSSPASFSVSGEYSESQADNIRALQEQLKNFPAETGNQVRIVAPPAPAAR